MALINAVRFSGVLKNTLRTFFYFELYLSFTVKSYFCVTSCAAEVDMIFVSSMVGYSYGLSVSSVILTISEP